MSIPSLEEVKTPGWGGDNSASACKIRVSVHTPQKRGDGMNAYIVYKISVQGTNVTECAEIERRYNDFAWLRAQLVKDTRGILVPPLPDAGVLGRFSADFIELRRQGLEDFLYKILQHKMLSDQEPLKIFLYADTPSLKIEQRETQSATGWTGYFKSGLSAIAGTFTGAKEREKTNGDKECEAIEVFVDGLHKQLIALEASANSMLSKAKEVAAAWCELGLSCTSLAKFEARNEQQALSETFSHLGLVIDKLHVMQSTKVDRERVTLSRKFNYYIRLLQAIKEMMAGRHQLKQEYETAFEERERRRGKLQLAKQKSKTDEEMQRLSETAQESEAAVQRLEDELEHATARVMEEMRQFRSEKERDFRQLVADFVRLQIDYSKLIQNAWEELLTKLADI